MTDSLPSNSYFSKSPKVEDDNLAVNLDTVSDDSVSPRPSPCLIVLLTQRFTLPLSIYRDTRTTTIREYKIIETHYTPIRDKNLSILIPNWLEYKEKCILKAVLRMHFKPF